MLRCGVIGLGRQAQTEHIPALLESKSFEIVVVHDTIPQLVKETSKVIGCRGVNSIQGLLALNIDVAVVCVPHDQYLPIITKLAKAGVHIIKEKPVASTLDEASAIYNAVENKVFLGVVAQRRFDPIYQELPKMIEQIGKVFSIEGKYTMNVRRLDEGWRAKKNRSGGGALMDMGYHFIDLLIWYFGVPDSVSARTTQGNRVNQNYDVEDTVHIMFDYTFSEMEAEKTIGHFIISRVYPQKAESISVYGTAGRVELRKDCITLFNNHDETVYELSRDNHWPSPLLLQLNSFAESIGSFNGTNAEVEYYQLLHLAVTRAVYLSDEQKTSIDPVSILNPQKSNK